MKFMLEHAFTGESNPLVDEKRIVERGAVMNTRASVCRPRSPIADEINEARRSARRRPIPDRWNKKGWFFTKVTWTNIECSWRRSRPPPRAREICDLMPFGGTNPSLR